MRMNGETIITGSDDWTARVWSLNRGTCDAVLACHAGPILCVEYSPSDKGIITGMWLYLILRTGWPEMWLYIWILCMSCFWLLIYSRFNWWAHTILGKWRWILSDCKTNFSYCIDVFVPCFFWGKLECVVFCMLCSCLSDVYCLSTPVHGCNLNVSFGEMCPFLWKHEYNLQ